MAKGSDEPPMSWRRTLVGLEPADDRARAWWKTLKLGDLVALDGRRPRNIKHHRKYWILMQIVVDNSDDFDTPEQVHYAVKAAMGRGRWVQPGGARRALFIPDPTNFASMDQTAFERYYSEAVNVVLKFFLQGVTPDQLDAIAMGF